MRLLSRSLVLLLLTVLLLTLGVVATVMFTPGCHEQPDSFRAELDAVAIEWGQQLEPKVSRADDPDPEKKEALRLWSRDRARALLAVYRKYDRTPPAWLVEASKR